MHYSGWTHNCENMELNEVAKRLKVVLPDDLVNKGVAKAVNSNFSILDEITEQDIKRIWGTDVGIDNGRLTVQNISRKMTLTVVPDIKSSKPSQSAATLSESSLSSDLSDSDSDNLSNQVGIVKEEVKKNEEKVNHPREPTPPSKPFRGQKRAVPLQKDFKTELTKLRDYAATINKLLSKAEPKLNVLQEKSELCGEYYTAVGGEKPPKKSRKFSSKPK